MKFFFKKSFAHLWQIHSYICTPQTRPSLPNNFFHQLSPPPGLEPTTPGLPAQCLYRYATAAFLGIMVTKVFLILNLNNLMFKEIVLKNRKTSLVLESTISKVSKVNLNHFSTNWIRKCGISFKRIALILERKTNFFDSEIFKKFVFKEFNHMLNIFLSQTVHSLSRRILQWPSPLYCTELLPTEQKNFLMSYCKVLTCI